MSSMAESRIVATAGGTIAALAAAGAALATVLIAYVVIVALAPEEPGDDALLGLRLLALAMPLPAASGALALAWFVARRYGGRPLVATTVAAPVVLYAALWTFGFESVAYCCEFSRGFFGGRCDC